jgi:hypothetical protein
MSKNSNAGQLASGLTLINISLTSQLMLLNAIEGIDRRVSGSYGVGRDHIEPTGEKLSCPTCTDSASTNYRDAPYWFVKNHVIVSLKLVSASYNW